MGDINRMQVTDEFFEIGWVTFRLDPSDPESRASVIWQQNLLRRYRFPCQEWSFLPDDED